MGAKVFIYSCFVFLAYIPASADKLVSFGVRKNRLKTIGYVESKPVKPNDTDAGKAGNRRVEFRQY
jgi:outer membrane protein OmpA-like peptidoglycan-associated protein